MSGELLIRENVNRKKGFVDIKTKWVFQLGPCQDAPTTEVRNSLERMIRAYLFRGFCVDNPPEKQGAGRVNVCDTYTQWSVRKYVWYTYTPCPGYIWAFDLRLQNPNYTKWRWNNRIISFRSQKLSALFTWFCGQYFIIKCVIYQITGLSKAYIHSL